MATNKTKADRELEHNVTETEDRDRDRNEDPITGEPGAHPVGTGVGTAVGGAAAGLIGGAAAGPIGAGVGAVAGGIAGALAGKEIAERVDPTVEEEHWRKEYANRDYYDPAVDYEEVGPAYRYGWESRVKHPERKWDEAEPDLQRDWDTQRGKSSLDWQRARPASRDAWERIDMIVVEEVDEGTGQGETAKHGDSTPRVPK